MREWRNQDLDDRIAFDMMRRSPGFALVPAFVALMPIYRERPSEAHIAVNGYVLLFSAAASLLTAISGAG
jgi:hypothetical protein